MWLNNAPVAVFSPVANQSDPQVFYIHVDHIDTPRAVTDTEGNLRWRWLAEPFGTTAPETDPQGLGAFTLPLRMPGQYADSESGLFYNYFRDYDPTTGRYVQSDPIGLAGGINTYTYVDGNPISNVDPDGKLSLPGVIVVVGIGYGAYKTYTKYEKFTQEVETCKRQCESTFACGDDERTGCIKTMQPGALRLARPTRRSAVSSALARGQLVRSRRIRRPTTSSACPPRSGPLRMRPTLTQSVSGCGK